MLQIHNYNLHSVFCKSAFLRAQKYYTSEPQKDSIVTNHGKNSQEIKYVFSIVGYSLSSPSDVARLLSLNNGIVNPTFWDYMSSVTLVGDVISGLVNASRDKKKY